jgi:hypothetical protein
MSDQDFRLEIVYGVTDHHQQRLRLFETVFESYLRIEYEIGDYRRVLGHLDQRDAGGRGITVVGTPDIIPDLVEQAVVARRRGTVGRQSTTSSMVCIP